MIKNKGSAYHEIVFLLCMPLGVMPVFGQADRQAPPVDAAVLLYMQFQQQLPQAVVDTLHDELRTIMAPAGMRFEWRSLVGRRGGETPAELAIVTFKGHCDADNLLPHRNRLGALGWTYTSDGVVLPYIDVDCDAVREFLEGDLIVFPFPECEAIFGRALARVLAHELYHVFAHTNRHGSYGIAKAAYTVQDLLSDEFHFEKKALDILRSR